MPRICVIRQGQYPLDPRVRNEVDVLVGAGYEVDVICRYRRGDPGFERRGAITVRRLPIPQNRGHWAWYLAQYAAFMIAAAALVGVRHLRRRYDLIQVNTMPDTLVFSALLPRLLGVPVLLDLQECMPEFMATKFGVPMRHPATRFVARMEQAGIRFADFAITCTAQMRDAFVRRGAAAGKVDVILNTHGLIFRDHSDVDGRPLSLEKRSFNLICHGSIEERYGLDTLLQAAAILRDEIPELRVSIYGGGSYERRVATMIRELGLDERVELVTGWVPLDQVLGAIVRADVGVVAMKRDAFRDLTLCNKMFDFIGMGKPAIVSRTRAVEEYFGERCFEMFTADDPADLARAIRRLHADPVRRRQLAEQALEASEPYRWSLQSARYLDIVNTLVHRRARPSAAPEPLIQRSEEMAS